MNPIKYAFTEAFDVPVHVRQAHSSFHKNQRPNQSTHFDQTRNNT
jgi:hypothetical protein